MITTNQTTFDFRDGNGPVLAHRHTNGNGWVADTAQVAATAYVGPDALVFGNAQISGVVWVSGVAKVFGNARISNLARIVGSARVFGDARVFDSAQISNVAWVYGDAWVFGGARVSDCARVSGDAKVFGSACVYGNAKVCGDVWTWNNEVAPDIESQKILARKILTHAEHGKLLMGSWHCATAHCIAGWCQVETGAALNDKTAYEVGIRTLPALAPYFFASNEEALAALRKFCE